MTFQTSNWGNIIKKGKATSFDIAHLAGVSQPTVSRALRNSPLVNKKTRERIQSIAKELHYKVDKNASNLRTQQSGTIALLLFRDPTSDESQINPFFLSMLGSITQTCNQKGYDLLVSFQELKDDWHADYEDTHKADGLILLGYGDYTDYKEKLIQLDEQDTKFVRWGAVKKGQPGISIGSDNYQGGYAATQHLIQFGRKKVAFIGNASKRSPEFFDRYKGSRDALKQADLEVNGMLQRDAISTEQSGYEAANELLNSDQPFDAIYCASDLIAFGVIKALRESEIKVPEEVAIVGHDNIPLAGYIRPPLTTIFQDTKKAGEILVDTLLKRIHNVPVEASLLPAELIVRDSCGAKNI